MRKPKLGVGLLMTLKTGVNLLAWVDDEYSASATRLNVFTPRSVAGLATRLTFHRVI